MNVDSMVQKYDLKKKKMFLFMDNMWFRYAI